MFLISLANSVERSLMLSDGTVVCPDVCERWASRGLCWSAHGLVVAQCNKEGSRLLIFDASAFPFKLLHTFHLSRVGDIHGIAAAPGGKEILCCDTEHNRIVTVPLDYPDQYDQLFKFTATGKRHVNSVVIDNRGLRGTDLGPEHKEGGWRNAVHGMLWGWPRGFSRPVYFKHPHSLCQDGVDQWAFCESATGRLLRVDEDHQVTEIVRLRGYLRGLRVLKAGCSYVVGASPFRAVSSHSPTSGGSAFDLLPGSSDMPLTLYQVTVESDATMITETEVKGAPNNAEIFDILQINSA